MVVDPYVISVASAVFAGGMAWGGARRALNGSRERIKVIETKLDRHMAETVITRVEVGERLARIEARID